MRHSRGPVQSRWGESEVAEKPGYAKKIAKFFPNLTWFLGSIDPEATEADADASFVF